MSEELDDALADIDASKALPIYLVVGEEFLVRKAADALVKRLVPGASVGLNFATMDGASPREIAQELATLPLFPGLKVVLLRDPEFLAPKKTRGDGLAKAREAWRSGRRKEAARRLLALAARAGWGVDQLDPTREGAPSIEKWRDELNVELAEADVAFLKEVAAFCADENITAPESDVSPLVDVLSKNLPKDHALVIASSEVDAKNALARFAVEHGAKIERQVAARLKDLDLGEVTAEVLKPFKKRLSRDAEAALKDRCGGNMRLLQSELEKLALYVDGPTIELDDVELLVQRAREEEYLELSDALQKRDFEAALRYATEAMAQGTHPLQLLGSIASVMRTLLENHERMRHLSGGTPPRGFDEFKSRIFPTLEREAKEHKARVPHPYAAFMAMQAAARYRRSELTGALVACADVDIGIKTSANGRLAIERLLWSVCARQPLPPPVRYRRRR